MFEKISEPDYLFEISWEVCNKVSGIYTTLLSKALTCVEQYDHSNYFLIGPWLGKTFPEDVFTEKKALYKGWKKDMAKLGITVHSGYWNTPGNPITFLIDYTEYQRSDLLLQKYIPIPEPHNDKKHRVVFGIIAAMAIESFVSHFIPEEQKIITHFHDISGGTGALYLRLNCRKILTVYTIHSTFLSRKIASTGQPFYDELDTYVDTEVAAELNVMNEHLLEKNIVRTVHVLTAISDYAAAESEQFFGREADIITPNGFEENIVPESGALHIKHIKYRKKLYDLGVQLSPGGEKQASSLLIGTSGRLEMRNKGFDLFIEALSRLNESQPEVPIIAYFFVAPPVEKQEGNNEVDAFSGDLYVPKGYHADHSYNLLFRKIAEHNLLNKPDDDVKIVVLPGYIENLADGSNFFSYYDLLSGLDLTVFPSYYEPWGYRPLESLAFKVPTITTSFSGFGLWIRATSTDYNKGIAVLERYDDNEEQVVKAIVKRIHEFTLYKEEQFARVKQQAAYYVKLVLWENLFANYKQAYSLALKSVPQESHSPLAEKQV